MKEITVQGIVQKVFFNAPDGGFCAFMIKDDNEDILRVAANCRAPKIGDELAITGRIVTHKTYGEQMAASFFEKKMPDTLHHAIQYLDRLHVRGLGPKSLDRIAEHFKGELPSVLAHEPERLREVEGLRKTVVDTIVQILKGEGVLEGVNAFFNQYGISGRWSHELYDLHGDKTLSVIKNNPYYLLRVCEGFSFAMADRLAMALGFAPGDYERLEASILYTLQRIQDDGHTCLPIDEVIMETFSMVGGFGDAIADILDGMISASSVYLCEHDGVQYIYTPELYQAEVNSTARTLDFMDEEPVPLPMQMEGIFRDYEQTHNIALSDRQKEAVEMAVAEHLSVITGGPGTGKTTIIKVMVEAFQKSGLSRIILCAPTGRAAKRLSEATTYDATTIHRLLLPVGVGSYEFTKNADDPLEADVVIIDEASMLNVRLYDALLAAIPPSAVVVLVGDVDQLPPIGAGFVLRDLIDSQVVRFTRLTDIYRQKEGNTIIENAHRINEGKMPSLIETKDFKFIDVRNLPDMMSHLAREYEEALQGVEDSLDVEIISPMRRKAAGSKAISEHIQTRLSTKLNAPMPGTRQSIKINGQELYVGDKVIQNSNNYDLEIFNGEIGVIYSITNSVIMVRFIDKDVVIPVEDALSLSLAYAITVHKSQGSEYKTVIIPFIRAYGPMLQRNLLYTAITRAKEKVIIIGTQEALQKAVETVGGTSRYSLFRERLIQEV